MLGIFVLLYMSGRLEVVVRLEAQRTWNLPVALYLLHTLLFVLIGFLLVVPGHWTRRRELSLDLGVLGTYLLAGSFLVGSAVLVQAFMRLFGPHIESGVWSVITAMNVLANGGARSVGGVLIGYGIGQALFKEGAADCTGSKLKD
jgi:hypothetical protein